MLLLIFPKLRRLHWLNEKLKLNDGSLPMFFANACNGENWYPFQLNKPSTSKFGIDGIFGRPQLQMLLSRFARAFELFCTMLSMEFFIVRIRAMFWVTA